MISGHLSIRYGLRGPNLGSSPPAPPPRTPSAWRHALIQYGDADMMVAGGAEWQRRRPAWADSAQAKAMSTRNDSPQTASRPWDRDRDGFVLADGGGAMVLEDFEHARKRGARIYAELVGFGMSGDAYHITSPPEDGDGARRAMVSALRDAQLNPGQVQYLNAHATSTPLGDLAETHRASSTPLASTRAEAGGQLHQIDDRTSARRGRRARGDFWCWRFAIRSRRRRSIWTIRIEAAIWISCRIPRAR